MPQILLKWIRLDKVWWGGFLVLALVFILWLSDNWRHKNSHPILGVWPTKGKNKKWQFYNKTREKDKNSKN